MRTTNAEVIGRIRTRLKAVKQDAFLTDRFLYGVIKKHAKQLMKREDSQNKLMRFNSVFQTLPYVEMIEVDKIEGGIAKVKSDIKIRKSKEKLPAFAEGYWGALIRDVTSLDGSEALQPTNPGTYTNIANSKHFKFNKTKYYWRIDDHIYSPDIDWDAVRVEGIFEDDISKFTNKDACTQFQDLYFNMPDYLLSEMENLVMKDLGIMFQLPQDDDNNKESPLRP